MSENLLEFLNQLVESGRVRVSPNPLDQSDRTEVDERLQELDRDLRLEYPGSPPPLFLPAARWSLRLFHDACRFLVHRDIDSEEISQRFSTPCPEPESPLSHYSVDLIFRFLPELCRFARAASADDPLLRELLQLANDWPMSSVGVEGVEPRDLTPILEHPALCGIYVDRIIVLKDKSRLGHPQVQLAAQGAWGLFPELATSLSEALRPPN